MLESLTSLTFFPKSFYKNQFWTNIFVQKYILKQFYKKKVKK